MSKREVYIMFFDGGDGAEVIGVFSTWKKACRAVVEEPGGWFKLSEGVWKRGTDKLYIEEEVVL